jgi:Na+/H+ ion antiporter subunit
VARIFGAAFLFAGAFYLLLIDTTTSPELYAGAGAALLAALACATAWRNGLRGVSPHPRWLMRGARAVAQVPADIFWVSLAALQQLVAPRRVRGELRATRFHYGDADDGRDMARRALAEAVGSLTPNTIVIGVDEERNLILGHQLRRSAGADGVDVLGLG